MNIFVLLAFLLVGCWQSVLSQVHHTPKEKKFLRIISVDYTKVRGPLTTLFKECVGAGRANEGLRADWQQQLALTKQECGFKYIRMHGLLCDDMGVYQEDENGNPQYNYQYIDVLYDFILSIGMKPFVELSFMPYALARGPKTIFWWRGNVTPPKDFKKWEDLIYNIVLHFTERYGASEVETWYFEVWNEPNLDAFWDGTQEEYFKLYEVTARAIKRVNTTYRVGGPATAGAAWVPEMITYCHANNVPIDFISTHSYGVKHGYLDELGKSGTILSKDEWSVSGDVLNSRKQIAQSPMPHLELHYTEWSSSYTPSDPIHDSYHQAAYILQKLKQVGDAPNSMSYWVFTDIFEEAGPRFTPFHGGFGLLNYQGIKKPAYYAYMYLNKLGEYELHNSDSASFVCKDRHGNIQILLWDFTHTHPGDSVLNQMYYIRDLPSTFKGTIRVEVSNLPAGRYKVETYQIGYKVNDAYTTYYLMGSPKQLTREQVATIKRLNNGAPISIETVTITHKHPFQRDIGIRENDVYLLTLSRQK
ncbi:MAG: glycoside hydrolase [Bacteroidetes bacterium]|nr:glycoside hydrolase [Bacteroidota bacterium]